MIDIVCFRNDKNYSYALQAEIKDHIDINDEYAKWSHHEWIRHIIPYFINDNELVFYLNRLNETGKMIDVYGRRSLCIVQSI